MLGPLLSMPIQVYCSGCDIDGGKATVLVKLGPENELKLQYPDELTPKGWIRVNQDCFYCETCKWVYSNCEFF